MTQKNSEQHI